MAISDPDCIGKSLKPNNDSFKEGCSDHLLLVYENVLLKFEEKWTLKKDILESKILNLSSISSTSVARNFSRS